MPLPNSQVTQAYFLQSLCWFILLITCLFHLTENLMKAGAGSFHCSITGPNTGPEAEEVLNKRILSK